MSYHISFIPLINYPLFNKIIQTTTIFINQNTTRSQTKTTHGCLYTQFVYICLCLLNDVSINKLLNVKNINQYYVDDKINNISFKISKIYQNISLKNRYTIPMIFNNVYKNLITPISNLNDLQLAHSSYYRNNNESIIIPMCIYIENNTDNDFYIIIHYFTLLIFNNTFFISSSYGADDICVQNTTLEIDINNLDEILNLFNSNMNIFSKKNNLKSFIEHYFLPNIDDEITSREIDNIIEGKIGIINNYFTLINEAIGNTLIGGKYKTNKYKTKKYKSKKYKTNKYKPKKYKTNKYKSKKYKTNKYKPKNTK